jgi:site-specific DNA recombinase
VRRNAALAVLPDEWAERFLAKVETWEAEGSKAHAAILSWKLDRLARNFDDGGKIIGLLQRGVIQEIRTFEKSYLPSDNVLMIAVELGMANQYVRDLSVNIRRGIREKVRRGIYSGKAPIGYVNDPKTRTIEPHPKDFPKMKRIMERFATGQYSLTAIQREMKAAGLVGRLSGKPLALSSIGNVLGNPFYYGVFMHKGEMHQGAHVPMISKATFDAIQKARIAVGKPRKRRKEKGFSFLNFATCAACGCAITGERHVKKSGLSFSYYRCTHKNRHQPCDSRSFVRDTVFAQEVRRNAALAVLPDEWAERFLAKVETWEAEGSTVRQEQIGRLTAQLDAVKAKIDRLNTAFADGSLELAEFREMKNPLIPQKADLEGKIAAVQKAKAGRLEPLRNWINEARQAGNTVERGDGLEMKSFLQNVGSNRVLRAQTLTISFLKPWDSLVETNLTARSAAADFDQTSRWWTLLDSNQ